MEQKRNFLAIILICIIVVLTPKWMSLFGPKQIVDINDPSYENLNDLEPPTTQKTTKSYSSNIKEKNITIITDL